MERQLRNKVEIEVQRGMDKKQEEKLKMNESKQVALKLYQDLCERLNMKCPRCELVFDDYTGCNALTCRGQSCRAAFCAICLKDCDTNAHHHVRTCHGDLFDKKAFNTARKKREIDTINDFSAEISGEPHEVKELVRIEFEKSQSDQTQYCEGGFPFAPFLSRAKRDLLAAVNSGRLSILSDAEAYPVETGLTRRDISPRNVIPENYRLRLLPSMENIYSIILEEQVHTINGIAWKKIALQDEKEIRSKDLDRPTVDALKNIAMALSCGVVAFLGTSSLYQSCISRKEGKYDRDEAKDPTICVQFHKICRNGNMEENGQSLSEERDVIGVDQNVRMLILADHVLKSSNESMSFEPLQHFVTGRQPSRVFTSISMPPPPSFLTLNNKQQKVAHPLSLLTAMEVAGPPGTGKTKTIMELVRGILHCTDYDVILMSERNGAIDAIAEKMAGDCLTLNQSQSVKSVSNVELWSKVLSFGSFGGMGPFSALFTSTAKELYHPEVLEADRVLKKKIKFMENYSRRLREAFSRSIYDLEGELFEESKPSMRGRLIQNNKESNLENARDIISSTINALGAVKQFRADSPGKQNSDLVILPLEHSAILRDLIPINCEKADHHSVPKSITSNPKAINRALEAIERRLQEVLQNKLFNVAACEAMDYSIRLSQSSLQDVRLRIKIDLQKDARVFLSTIGSSHKINKSVLEAHRVEPEIVSLDEDALNEMQRMNEQTKPTIVIFDEAGCIPSYELLGLSRLGRSIKSIICVGDKHQLPPYNPGSTKNDFKKGGSFGNVRRGKPVRQPEKVQTLLDASGLRSEKVKVEHTEQYRVPRDIAGVLNARIYRGNYQTSVHCNAPIKGFRLVNVPKSGRDQPYVNHDEIDACIQLVESSLQAGLKHTMVLTPYKKQQREMEFRFKKKGWNDILSVLTIDQCQGQQADIVILSLVRKPTRFLDKNRLNVALSRACQKMYFLCDKNLFVEASQNQAWECHLLAKDLLDLAGN